MKLAKMFVISSIIAVGLGAATNPAMAPIIAYLLSGPSVAVADETKYDIQYKGLYFYKKNKSINEYKLEQLSDSEFNALGTIERRKVADKLLSTLFFGYPYSELNRKIASGHFISDVRDALNHEATDRGWLENYIVDESKFRQNVSDRQASMNILARFYAMKHLDSYFYKNWIAYILTQTIMFSPAYELESSHYPNVSRVYNRLVRSLDDESSMAYITYIHMLTEDNWRRFRSPEDNGREMMEIFTLDFDDSHVPLAGKALQNWKLDRDNDTLVIGLNENRDPLSLFGTTVINGDDFYRELVKSAAFTTGVTSRLVDFFFLDTSESKKATIINSIVSSHPETFQDILTQMIFSKEYLLHTSRAKSAEELFFSLSKKISFRHYQSTFYYLHRNLEEMHQAVMKYKLGKLNRVPLDSLSFAKYHKYIRENMLLRRSNNAHINDYGDSGRYGWSDPFIAYSNFNYNISDEMASLDSLVQYLFHTLIARNATSEELQLFREHMRTPTNQALLNHTFDMFITDDDYAEQERLREIYKGYITIIVLDYISRLDSLYMQEEVE
jgi:hypothetical protein